MSCNLDRPSNPSRLETTKKWICETEHFKFTWKRRTKLPKHTQYLTNTSGDQNRLPGPGAPQCLRDILGDARLGALPRHG